MADAAFQTTDPPETLRAPGPEPVPLAGPVRVRKPSPELVKQLRAQWESLRHRVQDPAEDAGRKLARELRANTNYLKYRARDYHEHQPLQVLAVAAAAGFVLGMMLGFLRKRSSGI
jgi:ElaB/YqjD/DUF883 family membrane-anchored ribosome-binding protein